MVQRDYILRIIEQLGAALVQMRRAILGGTARAEDVESTLRRGASAAGMDLEIARLSPIESLPDMIAPTGEIEPHRCWVLAEMFLTDGIHQNASGRPESARVALAKAASLFKIVGSGAYVAGYPEADERIREIEGLLAEL